MNMEMILNGIILEEMKNLSRRIKGTGITQIVFGTLLIIISILDFFLSCTSYGGFSWGFLGSGIWSGLPLISTGIIGAVLSKRKTVDKCLMDGYLAMCILSTILSCGPIVCGAITIVEHSYNPWHYCRSNSHEFYVSSIVLSSLLITFGFASFVTSIPGGIYSDLLRDLSRKLRPTIIQTGNGPMVMQHTNPNTALYGINPYISGQQYMIPANTYTMAGQYPINNQSLQPLPENAQMAPSSYLTNSNTMGNIPRVGVKASTDQKALKTDQEPAETK
ncbi:hypothetical protein QYM36_002067 [Artemia franciscana]|uniref:Uncharacterized protein n=1 Tax=Artemia franciscana TaxID=6661 RepID=A0AA88LJ17_ARTSF|nr:hypothetical protein QYM36_002067 [Artemia franciscana]